MHAGMRRLAALDCFQRKHSNMELTCAMTGTFAMGKVRNLRIDQRARLYRRFKQAVFINAYPPS